MALIIQKDESGITDQVKRLGNHSTFSPYMSANQNRDFNAVTSNPLNQMDIKPLEPHVIFSFLFRYK